MLHLCSFASRRISPRWQAVRLSRSSNVDGESESGFTDLEIETFNRLRWQLIADAIIRRLTVWTRRYDITG